ncbi:hypothetical protein SKAU_G00242770 [Synaphobranchus kaupii]|uniref:Histone-lysine N-methyltransferase SETDB2 n=1 Tax=Synaphobranchus kaupii TaxID=118154 RepID=A0A9Q1F7U0_SYNKA|nr:hypothetical protein SKAU_G00242770 [Synaphobranchus kaupii]
MENIMPSEAEKAKDFWSDVDVSFVFDALCDRLQYLREKIEAQSATDREFIVGMNIILASDLYISSKTETDSIEEVLFNTEIMPVAVTEGDEDVEWKVESEVFQESSSSPLSLFFDRKSSPFSPEASPSPSEPDRDKLPLSTSPLPFERGELLTPLLPSQPENEDPLTPPAVLAPLSPPQTESGSPIAPLALLQPPFQMHSCSWDCVPCPALSADHFRGRNPLKVPLMWGFQRQQTTPQGQGAGSGGPVIFYKAPCGRSLRGPAEVMRYLCETEGHAHLHPGNFSFSGSVLLQRRAPPPKGARELLDADISRGAEPVAVQLWNEVDGGARPERFRYRTHRWPRSCLPASGPAYVSCCDCADGCTDKRKCSCLQLSLGPAPDAQLYRFRRLAHPVPSGVYECGPWCGCDRARCQNRVVQHGLQVRLQVFRTQDRGWGVRCRDDLDEGTFVCTYTGVVLRTGPDSGASCLGTVTSVPSPHKRKREEQSSDDEVEVVEEWRVPAVERSTPPNPEPPNTVPSNPSLSASPPVHVSVIKTPAGPLASDSERAEGELQAAGEETGTSPNSGAAHPLLLLSQTDSDAENGKWEGKEEEPGLNSEWAWLGEGGERDGGSGVGCHTGADEEHLYYLDATEEGNVGRFLNHSCCPNLFVQNVFMDSHHRDFPTVAFFTSRPVPAGTELTWNYSYDPGSVPEQEVPCQCGCDKCQGSLI